VAERPLLAFTDAAGAERRARWWSESPPPPRLVAAGDATTAAEALRHARAGTGLVYAGDFHNARQLLDAVARRLVAPRPRGPGLAAAFAAEREGRRVEQAVLSRLALPFGPGWSTPLRRAPPLGDALGEAFGPAPEEPALLPLREVRGAIGAFEWLRRGVPVPALSGAVHPRYGVFAPVRGEYVELVAEALRRRPPPPLALAFDVGTGTGVLALLLARAGARVVATDVLPAAVRCAAENAARFGLAGRVEAVQADLFPDAPARAHLVVANPPWVPGPAHGPLDAAVYDPGGALLDRLVAALPAHLAPGGEAWLVLGDLAERLGLRAADHVAARAGAAGLRIALTLETPAAHRRAREGGGPLGAARAAERTRLYVLVPS
jgi:SAM-dependent methyltransferase